MYRGLFKTVQILLNTKINNAFLLFGFGFGLFVLFSVLFLVLLLSFFFLFKTCKLSQALLSGRVRDAQSQTVMPLSILSRQHD